MVNNAPNRKGITDAATHQLRHAHPEHGPRTGPASHPRSSRWRRWAEEEGQEWAQEEAAAARTGATSRLEEQEGLTLMASLRVEHNPEQGTNEARGLPFVVFVNDGPKPRYRLTRDQAYGLLKSLEQVLGTSKNKTA